MKLLRDLRVDNDLTQSEVASIFGISQQHYSKYETGEYELPLRHFIPLANHYQVSPDYLIGRHQKLDVSPQDMVYLTPHCTCGSLLRDILQLNSKDRQAVVEYVHLQKLKEQSENK